MIAASLILLALIGGAVGTVYGVIEAGKQQETRVLKEQAERERDAAEVARDGEKEAKAAAEQARDGEGLARKEAESARDDLAKAQEKLARVEYGRTMQVAHQEWRDNNIAAARTLLDGTRSDLRGWEWRYVHRLCHSEHSRSRGTPALSLRRRSARTGRGS